MVITWLLLTVATDIGGSRDNFRQLLRYLRFALSVELGAVH